MSTDAEILISLHSLKSGKKGGTNNGFGGVPVTALVAGRVVGKGGGEKGGGGIKTSKRSGGKGKIAEGFGQRV